MVAISGGFDPIHRGHIELIQEAATYGPVTVFLNSDRFLMNKKGYVFMPFDERKYVLEHIVGVDSVIAVIDEDQTVCETLRKYRPQKFINGGDRDNAKSIPEADVCAELGIEMVFTGQPKVQSSQALCSPLLHQQLDRKD